MYAFNSTDQIRPATAIKVQPEHCAFGIILGKNKGSLLVTKRQPLKLATSFAAGNLCVCFANIQIVNTI